MSFPSIARWLLPAFLLLTASAPVLAQTQIHVNEFFRNGNLGTTDEWVEVVLDQSLTAAQLDGFFVGDSTGTRAGKFAGYRFTNMGSIAASFPAGTIIVVAGTTGPAADSTYNPSASDWNLTLKTSGSNITANANSGDFAGTDVAYVDTNGTANDATLSVSGFAVTWPSPAAGSFGLVASVAIAAPANTTGAVLTSNLAGATTAGNWTTSVALASMTPGQPNGGANTTYIDGLRENAPSVTSTTPANSATSVALAANIDITFSESVNFNAGAFTLECPAATAIPFTLMTASPATTVTLNPDADLPLGTTCTVTTLAASITDADANDPPDNMAANYAFSFTTLAASPVVSFITTSVSQNEGDAGTTNFVYTLDLTPAPVGTVSFNATVTGSGVNPADAGDFGAGADFGNPVLVSFSGASVPPYTITIPVTGDVSVEPGETFTLTLDNFSGTDPSQPSPISATGTIQNDDAPVQTIAAIQGAGSASPLAVGTDVKVVGAVVTAVTLAPPGAANGFFMQSPDAAADADPLTSEGIFVFTGTAPTVVVGNEVSVVGKVAEFFSQTQIDNVVSVTVTAASVTLPTPIVFSTGSGIPSSDLNALSCPGTGPGGVNNVDTNFECFEGMRVTIPDGIVTRANLRRTADLYAEVFVMASGQRSRREQGVNFPSATSAGNAAAGQFDSNPELFEMDADEAGLAFGELTAGTTFNATGVMGYSFGDYEFYPTQLSVVSAASVPQAVIPSAGDDELTVGSFNTKHLCDDNTADSCTRDTLIMGTAATYAQKLTMVSAYVRTVLGSPDVLGVQEVDALTTLQDLAAQIAADTGNAVQYTAHLVEGNDPGGIDVGYLTRNSRVSAATVTQFFKTTTWPDPNGLDLLHDRPPLLLRATFDGPNGPYQFAVLNNHTKARSQVDNISAAAERDRAKRFWQAEGIAGLVQAFQTATGDFAGQGTDQVPLILVGDYNAFEYTDGYVDVVGLIAGNYDDAANECNAVLSGGAGIETCNLGSNIVVPPLFNTGFAVPENERISYLFTQNFGVVQGANTRDVPAVQVIDHILLSRTAQGFYVASDYGIANNAASDETARNSLGAINSSDHDGLVAYLDFDCLTSPTLNPDGDQVCGMLDNCPNVSNNDQADGDGDGIGDACDTNNAPTISDTTDQSTNEDVAEVVNFTIDDAETAVTCTATHLSATSTNLTLVPLVNIVFSGTAPNCTATITPAANLSGTSTITLTVTDGSLTASDSFDLTVTAVNDAPSFTVGANQTVAEDAGAQSVSSWATNLSAGPADENGQTLSFVVTGNTNTALFSSQPSVDASGALSYAPAANANGSATITLRIQDNGGTAGGGVDTSATQTFDIIVSSVNDAPTISAIPNVTVNLNTSGQANFTINDVDHVLTCSAANLSASSSNAALLPVANIAFGGTAPNCTATLTPVTDQAGSSSVTVTASDGSATASSTFTFTVDSSTVRIFANGFEQ